MYGKRRLGEGTKKMRLRMRGTQQREEEEEEAAAVINQMKVGDSVS